MATVKVKFRASSVATKEGTLFYQVIHKRIVRQIHTGYKLFPAEWDAVHSEVVLSSVTSESRRDYLLSLKNSLLEDSVRLKNIIPVLSVQALLILQIVWWNFIVHPQSIVVSYPLLFILSRS